MLEQIVTVFRIEYIYVFAISDMKNNLAAYFVRVFSVSIMFCVGRICLAMQSIKRYKLGARVSTAAYFGRAFSFSILYGPVRICLAMQSVFPCNNVSYAKFD